MTPADFVQSMLDAFSRVAPDLSSDGRDLLIAQAAHESGWGQAIYGDFNYWNTTQRGPDKNGQNADPRPYVNGHDIQYNADGTVSNIHSRFTSFSNLDSAIQDLLGPHWFSRGSYAEAKQRLYAGDFQYLENLYNLGYYTEPPYAYTDKNGQERPGYVNSVLFALDQVQNHVRDSSYEIVTAESGESDSMTPLILCGIALLICSAFFFVR